MARTQGEYDRAPQDVAATDPGPAPAPLKVAVRLPDGAVCVTILDPPPHVGPQGVCRCGACHAVLTDLAVDYL